MARRRLSERGFGPSWPDSNFPGPVCWFAPLRLRPSGGAVIRSRPRLPWAKTGVVMMTTTLPPADALLEREGDDALFGEFVTVALIVEA
jgi:hypothetical protein